MQDLDLAPDSRSYHLREMYWQREQEQYRVCKALVGSGKATLVGKAQDFADARDYCNDGCSEVILGGKSTISFKNFDTLPMLNQTVQRGAQEAYASFGRDNKGPQE